MIDGVKVVQLKRIPDERGTIYHMLKRTDPHFSAFYRVDLRLEKRWQLSPRGTIAVVFVSMRLSTVLS